MMQRAAKGWANLRQSGLNAFQLQAVRLSRGNVPTQNAIKTNIVSIALGAAAAAMTNTYNQPQGMRVLVKPQRYAVRDAGPREYRFRSEITPRIQAASQRE